MIHKVEKNEREAKADIRRPWLPARCLSTLFLIDRQRMGGLSMSTPRNLCKQTVI